MRWKPPSDGRLRSRFDALARLVATAGSRANGVFSEAFDEVCDELRPSLGMAFALKGDTLTLLAEFRLGSMVPSPLRQFKAGDPLARPLQSALRTRRVTQMNLQSAEAQALFGAWGRLIARDADVAFVLPAVYGADVLALSVFFFNERANALDEGVLPFLDTASALFALALALQGEREREAARSAELAETTRLATLGTLSATVAHELRGPAGALALLVPELQQTLGTGGAGRAEALEPLLNDMRTCVERIGGLCKQLGNLNYHDEAPEGVDLRAVASEVVALARVHAQGAGVEIVEEFGPASVVGRRDQIGQVILNLALNAIDACRDGAPEGKRLVAVSTSIAEGAARIEVADSGPGLSESDVERIFQPFFTTKPRGKGTGLGLSVSRDIVATHRGHIEVARSRWGGALFRVVLPAHDEAALSRGRATQRTPGALPVEAPPARPSASDALPPSRAALGSAPELPPSRAALGSAPELPPPRAALGSAPDASPRAPARPAGPATSPRPPVGPPRATPPPVPSRPAASAPGAPPPPRPRIGPPADASAPRARPAPPPLLAPPPASSASLGSGAQAAAPATLRVLFVDDDLLLLRTMKRVMRGCDVNLASTIEQARAALEAGAPFDVVVTDVNMPGGSGLDLHRRLALEKPALVHKLIFLSGGALTPADADYLRSSGCLCLNKPVTPDSLLEAVRSVARAGRPPAEGSLTLRPPPSWRR